MSHIFLDLARDMLAGLMHAGTDKHKSLSVSVIVSLDFVNDHKKVTDGREHSWVGESVDCQGSNYVNLILFSFTSEILVSIHRRHTAQNIA